MLMNHIKHSRGIRTLLALALLVPSITAAQDGGAVAQTSETPVVSQTEVTGTPNPTNTDTRPIRPELIRRGDGVPKPEDSWSFGESNPQISPPVKGVNTTRLTPTTTRPIDDRMLRRASGTPPIPAAAQERLERREGMASGTLPANGQIRERMEEARARMAEARQEQMKEFVRKTIARMRAAIERLSKLAGRIESRIQKMESAASERPNTAATSSMGSGKTVLLDFPLVKGKLTEAKNKIEEAKAALAEAESQFASYVPPEPTLGENGQPTRPQPGMGQPSPLRDALKKAEGAIKSAHKALTETVASMRILPTVNKAAEESSSQ